jgi:hypothetical protein
MECRMMSIVKLLETVSTPARRGIISVFLVASAGFFSFESLAESYATPAVSDAFVATGPTGNFKNNNYGGGGALALAAGALPNGEFQSVLKFDLSGARNSLDSQYGAGNWSIQSISLQLSSSPHNNSIYNEVHAGQFGISLMRDNSWIEGTGNASNPGATGINYNTLQTSFINPALDSALGTFNFSGGSSGLNQYLLETGSVLDAELMAGDNITLRLFAADNSVSYLFSSRAASSQAAQPELIISAIPEPGVSGLLAFGIAVLLWQKKRSSAFKHSA